MLSIEAFDDLRIVPYRKKSKKKFNLTFEHLFMSNISSSSSKPHKISSFSSSSRVHKCPSSSIFVPKFEINLLSFKKIRSVLCDGYLKSRNPFLLSYKRNIKKIK